MALPLAFAACTSDEFESQGTDINLAQRTEIGQVDLLLNLGEAETRWGGDMLPEVSDIFGAALVDAPKAESEIVNDPKKGKWETHYSVTDYISTNYPYTYNGNRWTSPAKLVEGSYLFYAPYAENHQVRSNIAYAAPLVQNLKVENGAVVENSALADVAENFKSPFYFAYKFFDAADDNRNLSLTMNPIFAYPKFTLKNTTGEAVTITRIVLQSMNLDIPAKGEFDNTYIVNAMNNSEEGWGRNYKDYVRGNGENDVNTKDLIKEEADSYVPTNLIRADLSEPVTIANNGTMTFNLVVPAMEFEKGNLKVYFVNEEDMGYVYTNTNSTVRFVPARSNPKEEYNIGTGAALSSAGKLLTKTLAKDEPMESVPYIVTTTQELIDAIDNATPNQNHPLTLTIGGEIEFNADVLGAIAENLSQPVVFVGALDIVGSTDATKPMNINQKIIFDEATISGNVQFGKNADGGAAVGFERIKIEKDAALTIDALAESYGEGDDEVKANNASILNNGTLTVKTAVKKVVNNATLNIEKDGSVTTLSSENEGTHPEIVNINSDFAFGGDMIEGQWTVANGATLTLGTGATLPYNSTLTVDGEIEGGKLTVSGKLNVNGSLRSDVELDGVLEVDAEGAITKQEKAELNLGNNSIVRGAVTGVKTETTTVTTLKEKFHIRNVQVVNVAEGTAFIVNPTYDDLLVKQTINGNVEDEVKVNKWVKALEITGNVIGKENVEHNWANLDSLTIGGNIQAVNAAVKITMNNSGEPAIRVKGDILAGANVTLENATEVQAEGTFETYDQGSLAIAKVEKLILNNVSLREAAQVGWAYNRSNWTTVINGDVNVWLPTCGLTGADLDIRGNVTIAEGASFTISENKTATVNGDVTVEGKGITIAENVTVNISAGSKLTNKSTITGADGRPVTFASFEKAGETRGQMVNDGNIYYSRWQHVNDNWWEGAPASQSGAE